MDINFNKQTPYTWGLDKIDNRFWKPDIRELIVLFWYASSWKTEFSFFVARQNANRTKICYISLELPEYDMKLRICRKIAGVKKIDFQNKNYTDYQKDLMIKERDNLKNMENIRIESPEDKSLESITKIMRSRYDMGYRMFIIDNLDKIAWKDREDENWRHQRITSTLQDLKNEADFCIILIHHAHKPAKNMWYSQAGMWGMRWNQKIIDNATQVFEIYRDLDPECTEEEKKKVSLVQMKDTFEWANGYIDIFFEKWKYIEEMTTPF